MKERIVGEINVNEVPAEDVVAMVRCLIVKNGVPMNDGQLDVLVVKAFKFAHLIRKRMKERQEASLQLRTKADWDALEKKGKA